VKTTKYHKGITKNHPRHAELVSASPGFWRLRVKPAMTSVWKIEFLEIFIN